VIFVLQTNWPKDDVRLKIVITVRLTSFCLLQYFIIFRPCLVLVVDERRSLSASLCRIRFNIWYSSLIRLHLFVRLLKLISFDCWSYIYSFDCRSYIYFVRLLKLISFDCWSYIYSFDCWSKLHLFRFIVDSRLISCAGYRSACLHLRNTKEIGQIIYGWIAGSLSSTNNQLPAAGFATCFYT
jgi:hypothetical protein